jgi:catalase
MRHGAVAGRRDTGDGDAATAFAGLAGPAPLPMPVMATMRMVTQPGIAGYGSSGVSNREVIMRSIRIAPTVALAAALLGLVPAAAFADDSSVPEQIVDAMNLLFGKQDGNRANHAKGTVVEGSFTPSAEGAKLSSAALFQGATVPVTARFSDATGLPAIRDGDSDANPHGMAIRFQLPDGSQMDIVANSLAFFPVATGEEFRDLLQAVAMSGPDAAKPTPVERFMASHPAAPAAFASAATPSSFARETYNGIDAFVFVDAAGKRQPFRFEIVPIDGTDHLSAADAAKQTPDFLIDELPPRLAKQPAQFHLLAQLAQPGDPTADATKPWPADRKLVDLGTITITRPVADSAAASRDLLFLPTNLIDGIEPSDDPLIDTRAQAYAISFDRRSQ